MRYTGQGYELRIPLEGLFADRLDRYSAQAAARDGSTSVHAPVHGHAAKGAAVEVVSYRLRVRVAVPKYEPRDYRPRRVIALRAAAIKGTRQRIVRCRSSARRGDL